MATKLEITPREIPMKNRSEINWIVLDSKYPIKLTPGIKVSIFGEIKKATG